MNAAELILNPDGSIYHLNLLPEDVGSVVILVGDPGRVPKVSRYFNTIDVMKQKREFITHTGWIGTTRISVISTGIGTDNIDIVMNELDALVNIDFHTRLPKEKNTSLMIIRIGTSGSIHPDIHVDDIVVSAMGVGTDAIGMYYRHEDAQHPMLPPWAYKARRYPFDLRTFGSSYKEGITLTCPGFYGPQGRVLRTPVDYTIPIDDLHKATLEGFPFTNLEMETSAMYLFAEKMGHKAISFNVILAQRLEGKFSSRSAIAMDHMIQAVLKWVTAE